jgi:pimeloyl-ACP methyl ester carboxylesterase
MKKIILFIVIVFLANVICGQTIAQNSTYPPRGRLVDIGGRKLHLLCSGKGGPTIILVAGGGAFSIDWNLVQSKICNITTVCSYDRAGLGWSDSGYAEETVEETVDDLHKLLMAARERPPYILVGASIGGIFIQAYQHAFPDEVAGLVFSNSSNHIGFVTKDGGDLIWNLTEKDIRSSYPLPPYKNDGPLPTKVGEPFDKLPLNLQPIRLWLSQRLQEKWAKAVSDPAAMLSWRKEFLREFNESDSAKPYFPLGKLPVIVIDTDPKANDSLRYSRGGAAARLDYLSSNSLHIVAPRSIHEIHLDQPGVVVSALKQIVIALRKNILLSAVAESTLLRSSFL